jgi:hypothetical protein
MSTIKIAFWSVLAVTLAPAQDALPAEDQILERHVAVTAAEPLTNN